MKLQFKHQQYQLDAVNAVADCFNGEPFRSMQNYFSKREELSGQQTLSEAFANPELILQGDNLLANIQQVQLGKNLPKSDRLQGSKELPLNLDIEMETGTGKTYCYIRTLFELNRRYGWSKFIIVVPSIAIREGVKKSFEVMAEHFQQEYGKKARHFIYNSKRLHELDAFTADSNINVMIINIQAFNATGNIFSHSALREGWDNPNVFMICLLKHSDNNVSRRQEVGRGLRLAVDKHGVRQDEAATVHDINVLTVVANESYADFVSALQNELAESKSNRTRIFDQAFFLGKVLKLENGENVTINEQMARKIHRHLFKNDFVDDDDRLTVKFHQAIEQGEFSLPSELAEYKDALLALISQNAEQNQRVENDRTPKNRLNANFYRKEFQALWKQIHHKAVYQVDFDSQDLIEKAIQALDRELKVEPLLVTVQKGEQNGFDQFKIKEGKTEGYQVRVKNQNRYDLVGQLAKSCNLTRKTIAKILSGIQPFVFAKFAQNPEQFIQESTRLIDEQLATSFIEKLSYHQLDETFDTSLFVAEQSIQDFGRMVKTDKHIYDYVQVDSANTERQFAENLDQDSDVVVYAKLPNGFRIPTPVGDYNPDWAVSFKEGTVKYIYFVAETKGAMSSLELRGKERVKRDCARVFFNKINQGEVKYDVVDSFKTLLDIVKG